MPNGNVKGALRTKPTYISRIKYAKKNFYHHIIYLVSSLHQYTHIIKRIRSYILFNNSVIEISDKDITFD